MNDPADLDRLITRAKRRIRIMDRLPAAVAVIAVAGAVMGFSAPATLTTVVATAFTILAYLVFRTWRDARAMHEDDA